MREINGGGAGAKRKLLENAVQNEPVQTYESLLQFLFLQPEHMSFFLDPVTQLFFFSSFLFIRRRFHHGARRLAAGKGWEARRLILGRLILGRLVSVQ